MSKSKADLLAPKKRPFKIAFIMNAVLGRAALPDRKKGKARMEAHAASRIKAMKAGRDASNARPDGETWANGRIAG